RRDIGFIESQLHINEMAKLEDVVTSSRSNTVFESVNHVTISINLRGITFLQELSFKVFLNRSGRLYLATRHKCFNLGTIFTKFISDIPSITNILGDGESHFTRFDRGIVERNIFVTILNGNSADGLNV